jgi:HAD superfamily phosphatase (TIGR01668 family)
MFAFKDGLNIIRELIFPKYSYKSVLDIPLETLYESGIRTIFTDVDNTILPRSEKELPLQMVNWLGLAQRIGYTVYFVSNNSSYHRIYRVVKQTGISGIYFACKPLPFSTQQLIASTKTAPKKCLFIGDQILTDVLMGNWLKMTTILVEPFTNKLSLIKRLQFDIEQTLLSLFKK